MAAPIIKTKPQLVSEQAAAVQARASGLVDFSIGSILRAFVEAVADVATWLQALALTILTRTRAATSQGPDLTTWFADFGFQQLSASKASGQVTLARFSTASVAVVDIGSAVQTDDGSQAFTVVLDGLSPALNVSMNGYVLPVGTASIIVPVLANVAGSAGNVLPGRISTIVDSISGVDTVTNGAALVGGADAESDGQARSRFILWVNSRDKATDDAIREEVLELGVGVRCQVAENQDYSGATLLGHFVVVADDGTGTPSAAFLAQVSNAVDAVRPLTSSYEVHGPTLVSVAVTMNVQVGFGYTPSLVKMAVEDAATGYVNGLSLGDGLDANRLYQVAYDASPGAVKITALTVNGASGDGASLLGNPRRTIRVASVIATPA